MHVFIYGSHELSWLDFFCSTDWSLQMLGKRLQILPVWQVRADIPEQNYGGNVQIYCMLPKAGPKLCTKHWWNPLAISIGKHCWMCFLCFLFCHDFVSFFCFCTMEERSLAFLWMEVSGNLATVFIVFSSRSSPCHVTWDLCFCFHRAIKHCGPVGRVRRVKGERHQLVSEF